MNHDDVVENPATGQQSRPGHDGLAERVAEALPRTRADLEELIRIRSITSLPDHSDQVQASAERVAELLGEIGCPDVSVVAEGGAPAVIGRFPAPEGQPTICLYAHHDVQPTGDLSLWTHQPFEPTEVDGRLFARGAADDKGGIAVHLAALRAFGGTPPVGVSVFVEGEEEVGSPSLGRILQRHRDALAADVFVIADSVNWKVGEPSVTTTLRGIADCVVEVRTLDHALHSGQYGGVVPDALTSLCRLLATLHHSDGSVAVEGLGSRPADELDYSEQRLRSETGLLDGVEFIGSGAMVERIWTQPAISVLAIDAPSVEQASNTLLPSARAKVSLRVAPGDDAKVALQALTRHLENNAPWGAQVRITPGDTGQPGIIPFSGPIAEQASEAFAEAFGAAPVAMGCGGSIPMTAEFQQAFPEATILVTAVTDPDSRMHGIDESLSLSDLAKASLAEALLIQRLAR